MQLKLIAATFAVAVCAIAAMPVPPTSEDDLDLWYTLSMSLYDLQRIISDDSALNFTSSYVVSVAKTWSVSPATILKF